MYIVITKESLPAGATILEEQRTNWSAEIGDPNGGKISLFTADIPLIGKTLLTQDGERFYLPNPHNDAYGYKAALNDQGVQFLETETPPVY